MSVETDQKSDANYALDVETDRLEFEAAQHEQASIEKQNPIELSIQELSIGFIALALWFGLFAGGILMPTGPFRNAIAGSTQASTLYLVLSWLVVCAFWTITNIGILSCVSSFLGALGGRTNFTHRADSEQSQFDGPRSHTQSLTTYYLSAILRGFGVYSLTLAGLLVFATESLIDPTQAAYMRLAPTLSILSFYAGYDPNFFSGLLDQVKSFMKSDPKKKS